MLIQEDDDAFLKTALLLLCRQIYRGRSQGHVTSPSCLTQKFEVTWLKGNGLQFISCNRAVSNAPPSQQLSLEKPHSLLHPSPRIWQIRSAIPQNQHGCQRTTSPLEKT